MHVFKIEHLGLIAQSSKVTLIQGNKEDLAAFFEDMIHAEDMKLDDFSKDFMNSSISCLHAGFIEELKIKNHVSMIMKNEGVKNRKEKVLDQLQLSSILQKYPKQLNGKEKLYCQLYFSLVKDRTILIYNQEIDDCILEVLKDYANEGNIVICLSEAECDVDEVYTLKDGALVLKTFQFVNEQKEKPLHIRKDQLYFLMPFFIKTERFHFLYKVVLGFVWMLFVVGLCFNNFFVNQHKEFLNQPSVDEILVYEPIFDGRETYFNEMNSPLSEEVVQKMAAIEGVSSVEWRFDYLENGFSDDTVSKKPSMAFYLGDKKITDDLLQETGIHIYTLIDGFDYGLTAQYQEKGIYISNFFYELELSGKLISQGSPLYLEMYLPVPVYNADGLNVVYDNNKPDTAYPVNTTICQYEKVKLPVAGYLPLFSQDGDGLGQYDDLSMAIYIPQSIYQAYISQYKVMEDKEVMDRFGNTQIAKPWTANHYSVIIEDPSCLENVIYDLQELGLHAKTRVYGVNVPLNRVGDLNTILLGISTLMLLFVIVLGIRHQKEYTSVYTFLHENEMDVSRYRHRYCLYVVISTGAYFSIFLAGFIALNASFQWMCLEINQLFIFVLFMGMMIGYFLQKKLMKG